LADGLARFEFGGLLGEGAELQVFAATDTETGKAVVVKRPHPALVSRDQHRGIESKLEKLLDLRERLGSCLPHTTALVARTAAANHDAFFGDALGHEYMAFVDERAEGLPLIASVMDAIRRNPVGLPHNLFAQYPLVAANGHAPLSVAFRVLETAQALYDEGLIALDLRPQNVYFQPSTGRVTIIDVGAVQPPREATRRHPPLDLHDFMLELMLWYVQVKAPPLDASQYNMPGIQDSAVYFQRDARDLAGSFEGVDGESAKSARSIAEKIAQRSYPNLDEFEADLRTVASSLAQDYELYAADDGRVSAWRTALERLREPYWSKYGFDAVTDLDGYV
jgi:serine/threonine protein kinase